MNENEIKQSDKKIAKDVKDGVSDYFKPSGSDWGAKIKGMLGVSDPLQEALDKRKKKYANY